MKARLAARAVIFTIVAVSLAASDQESFASSLDRIRREYVAAREKADVRTLVDLDHQLRRLIPYWTWEGAPAPTPASRNDEDIGVRPLLFEPGRLSYSGKLLVEAHRLDAASYRSYTLYSTVFEGDEAANSLPAPRAAEAYLREFPAGQFALHAHLALAHFYADLFKVLRDEENGRTRDYKYDCFKEHIETGPLPEQRARAQSLAVRHYVDVVRLLPHVDHLVRELSEMRRGESEGWHYCAD